MKWIVFAVLVLFLALGCATNSRVKEGTVQILPVNKVIWEKLNPARGDKSPQAGTLWGDRKGEVETAFLAKFIDGFSSPPHIHNVSYRAIVIEGLVHNDDPNAATMWMPKGSFWTQPAGESHITSAKGKTNIAFVEIDKGPYLVKPTKEQFDNGERPYNIHVSNIIWEKGEGVAVVPTWKNSSGTVTGRLLKFSGRAKVSGESGRIVVVSGQVKSGQGPVLNPGSLVTFEDASVSMSCENEKDCVVYLKSDRSVGISGTAR